MTTEGWGLGVERWVGSLGAMRPSPHACGSQMWCGVAVARQSPNRPALPCRTTTAAC